MGNPCIHYLSRLITSRCICGLLASTILKRIAVTQKNIAGGNLPYLIDERFIIPGKDAIDYLKKNVIFWR